MHPNVYAYYPTLHALGIRESVRFLFNQIGWDYFIHNQHPTYRNLTLEFLNSLHYNPDVGLGLARGVISFKLFGFTHRYTTRELANLLDFLVSADVVIEVPNDEYLDSQIDYFCGEISTLRHDSSIPRHSSEIHNPTIRYFHMIMSFTLFGKPQNDKLVSKEELFIIFCVFRSRPVVGTSFKLARLPSITQAPHGPICVGGLVTMIADAIFQRERLSRLTPAADHIPLHLSFCFNVGTIRYMEPK